MGGGKRISLCRRFLKTSGGSCLHLRRHGTPKIGQAGSRQISAFPESIAGTRHLQQPCDSDAFPPFIITRHIDTLASQAPLSLWRRKPDVFSVSPRAAGISQQEARRSRLAAFAWELSHSEAFSQASSAALAQTCWRVKPSAGDGGSHSRGDKAEGFHNATSTRLLAVGTLAP